MVGSLVFRIGAYTHGFAFVRVSVTYGHPFMIDVGDCDARLPSSGDARDLYIDQLVRLSVIVGQVMKNIYTCVFYLPYGFISLPSSCSLRGSSCYLNMTDPLD